MTVFQLWRILRARWYIVIACTVLMTGVAGAFTFVQPKIYEARTQLFVSTSGGNQNDTSQLNQGGIFTQQRVKSYASLVNSPKVLDPVIAELGLPYTADELARRVTATVQIDTVLLDVAVQDESPDRAQQIANAIALAFPSLVESLETPSGRTASPVKISVTKEAVTPVDPVLPRSRLNLALGFVAGFLLGMGAALVRHSLDRRIHTRSQIVQIVRAPVLGSVVDDPSAAKRPLVIDQDGTPRAEAFRHLRTNIRFLSVDRQIRSFVVSSSLPDEGKTTTAANLAIALAQSGQPVVLIDADLRRPSLTDTFAVSGAVGLSTVLMGEVPVEHAMQQWRPDLPLYLLPAGPTPPNPSELLSSNRLERLLESFRQSNVVAIFDSPPLLPVTDAAVLARVTDGAVLVARMGRTRVEQLETATETLRSASAPILGIILNRVRRGRKDNAYSSYYGSAVPSQRAAGKGRAAASSGARASARERV